MHHTQKFVAAIAASADHGLMFMPYYMGNVVTDEYLQGLLASYRQGYTDSNGPDFEDSDAPLLAAFAAASITTNAAAYAMGARQAGVDIANHQEVHQTPGWNPGTPIPRDVPASPPPPTPTNAQPSRSDAEVYATFQRSAGAQPSNATSGPAGAMGYASFPQLSGYSQPLGGGGLQLPFGLDLTTLLILAAIGVGAYVLLKKK